ncbi:hypothetical protein [Desulfobacula sp.]|uniref:hypothetical protein n=1 Tax=Desulfobacula sp. TaxID=2593537 RepID=UPI0039B84178
MASLIEEDTQVGTGLLKSISKNQPNIIPAEKLAIVSSYVMIHWALDTTGQLEGYGFPFDCLHFIFYQRLKVLYEMVNIAGYDQFDKRFFNLWKPLNKIINDQQLKSSARQIEKKMETFKQLRKALSIRVSENKKGLNDDGDDDTNIKSIAQKVKQFRTQIMADEKLSQANSYKKMIKQIDTYWDKLFADPIIIETSDGQVVIHPQRTNNILERFFRELKRRNRKRSGSISLNRRLKTMLTDTPLIKNLDNKEYIEAILDGNDTLEERFEKIDSNMVIEKLKAEQKSYGKISPEMKKIIQRPDLPEELTALFAA